MTQPINRDNPFKKTTPEQAALAKATARAAAEKLAEKKKNPKRVAAGKAIVDMPKAERTKVFTAKDTTHLFKKGQSGNPSGKPKGATSYYNRLTNEERQTIAQMVNGLTPLELFVSVIRSDDAPLDARIDAAKAAAPYLHRKMPISIEGGDPNKPINIMDYAQLKGLSTDELSTMLSLLAKAGANIQGG